MLKRLQSLQDLKAEDCISLEEDFDVEGIDVNGNANANANEGATITELSQLILKLMPKVEKIWNKDPHGILSFHNLKSMMIDQCWV